MLKDNFESQVFGNWKISYKKPLRKRKKTNSQKLFTKLDTTVIKKAISNVGTKVFFRPRVSAKNPHRCDERIVPTYPIALKTPLSLVDISRSHCAIGRIILTEVSSRKAAAINPPERVIRM